jgi:hypothetical protein
MASSGKGGRTPRARTTSVYAIRHAFVWQEGKMLDLGAEVELRPNSDQEQEEYAELT